MFSTLPQVDLNKSTTERSSKTFRLITKADDPTHKQKAIYSLTEKGIALLPVLAQIGLWGREHIAASDSGDHRTKSFNRKLEQGGPAYCAELMAGLRATHLGTKRVIRASRP